MSHEFLLFPSPQSTDNVLSYSLKVMAEKNNVSLTETFKTVINSPEVREDEFSVKLIWEAFQNILSGTEEGVKAW